MGNTTDYKVIIEHCVLFLKDGHLTTPRLSVLAKTAREINSRTGDGNQVSEMTKMSRFVV